MIHGHPYQLKFTDQAQAVSVLSPRFDKLDEEGNAIPWDGVKQCDSNSQGETIVIPTEPVSLDENEEPLPGTWTGFHVDILLKEPTSEYDAYIVTPNPLTPAHSFGE